MSRGAAIVIILLVMLTAITAIRAARRRDAQKEGICRGDGGPYNIQLYDSPRYYPYYWARDYTCPWDSTGRCAAYCSAGPPCTVACR